MAVEFCGLRVTRLAQVAGVSRPTVYAMLEGTEPSEKTVAAVEGALALYAKHLAGEKYEVSHPGVTDLAADADLREAYRVGEEELASLRDVVVVWNGRPLVLRTKWQATALLEAVRRVVREPE